MKWLDLWHARYRNDGKFFEDGFGSETILSRSLVNLSPPDPLSLAPLLPEERQRVLRFPSPYRELLPEESQIAEALVVLPTKLDQETPFVIQLAATGDQGFLARQKLVAEPLAQRGIASLILENPYYGSRRPPNQAKTYLRKVQDLWAMGLAIVAESKALLEWLHQQGFQDLGVCGVSLGGAMASQVAALYHRPLAFCACIAPHCATGVFTEGVLSNYVDWDALGQEKGRQALAKQLDGSDLSLFPQPRRPDSAIWLAAKHDAYVSPHSSQKAAELWPGSDIRWLNSGHVGTTVFYKREYIRGIEDSFSRLRSSFVTVNTWMP